MKRPSIEEYFMNIAWLVATRSTCLRHKIGAVAVKDKWLLSSGYNERETMENFPEKGLSGFIHKPYLPRDLIKKINEILLR